MFLLTLDQINMKSKEVANLPETTLWNSFGEAFNIAMTTAIECGAVLDMEDAEFDIANNHLFFPNFCEITPISVSTADKITWMGEDWRKNR